MISSYTLLTIVILTFNSVSGGIIQWYSNNYRSIASTFSNSYTEGNVQNCGGELGDILDITSISYSPTVMTAGSDFTLKATGELLEDLIEGAYVHVVLNYDKTKLVSRTDDICQHLEKKEGNSIKCTIKKGLLKVSQDFTVPWSTPPGWYDLTVIGYNGDHSPIGCLNAQVWLLPQ
ncbi:hypothetical protein INT48_005613 [Thamnidium elegans]|uniref:Phosphatidylglycerol/phosphatidylinositol transfer protein n=1 Tax=Thamnidium elegans TaxID=101142 RepID=A0A8H7SK15_9FUNG|nr:hypothetical protein INT48_005613 [Thamnidium elegans]